MKQAQLLKTQQQLEEEAEGETSRVENLKTPNIKVIWTNSFNSIHTWLHLEYITGSDRFEM